MTSYSEIANLIVGLKDKLKTIEKAHSPMLFKIKDNIGNDE